MTEPEKYFSEESEGYYPEWDEELRCWLADYMAKHPHRTTSVLSRSHYIGISRSALDSYVDGTYFLPKEMGGCGVDPQSSQLEHAVRAYRERVEGTQRHGYVNTFVETTTWRQLQKACETALNENVIVVTYGRPGVGKTRGLLEFTRQKMTAAPISVLCSRNITPLYFTQLLARTLKIEERQALAPLEDQIAERLKRTPRPIFIDQANYLNEKSLGTICHIWEVARVPVVLVGTKDLYDLFNRVGQTQDIRAQIASRIAVHYLLSELTPAEAKAIIQRALGEDATDEAVALIYNITGGIHRHVDMIMPRIMELKAHNREELATGKITLEQIITVAGSRLMAG